jgi:hypothetical protein
MPLELRSDIREDAKGRKRRVGNVPDSINRRNVSFAQLEIQDADVLGDIFCANRLRDDGEPVVHIPQSTT